MLDITAVQEIHGVTVYGDDDEQNKFYVIPNQPRFRVDDNKNLVFKYIKYRTPVPRPDGTTGGGFLIFDSEFVVPEDILQQVKNELANQLEQKHIKAPVTIGMLTYSKGTAALQLLDGPPVGDPVNPNNMVERVHNAGKPSLFGHNVCAFDAELSSNGATLLEQALQGSGGVVQVIYDLYFEVRLPAIKVHVWFDADTFYSFFQQQTKQNDHWYNWFQSSSGTNTIRENLQKSNSGNVEIDLGAVALPDPEMQKKLVSSLTDWGWKALEEGAKEMALKDPEGSKAASDPANKDGDKSAQSAEWRWDNTTTDRKSTAHGHFDRNFTEKMPIEWHIVPQGTLPNITSLTGKDGQPVRWNDYATVVDLDDPFFRRFHVNVHVNCDWKLYLINSVDVTIEYASKIESYHFTKEEDIFKFDTYLNQDVELAKQRQYKYSYVVNYKDSDLQYKLASPIASDATELTIGVADLGLLFVEVVAGAVNFSYVALAIINLRYEGSNLEQPLEYQVRLDKDHQKDTWQHPVMQTIDQPVKYQISYTLSDAAGGKTIVTDWLETRSERLYINDVLGAWKTVSVRSTANFDGDGVDSIFVSLVYNDDANSYQQQTEISLGKSSQFYDWKFPIRSTPGTTTSATVTYSGTIKFKNGTVQDIPSATAGAGAILVGPHVGDILNVTVQGDLLDFTKVKIAKVEVHYSDADAQPPINVKHGYILKAGLTTPQIFTVKLADKTKTQYEYSVVYEMMDGQTLTTSPVSTEDDLLTPGMPDMGGGMFPTSFTRA